MNEFDLMIAYFGAAVAFAGFMGIVSQIDRRTALASPLAISFRIRVLTGSALILMFLSIFPFLAITFGAEDKIAWRIGCGVAMAVLSANLVVIVAITGKLHASRSAEAHPVNTVLIWVNNPLGAIALAAAVAGTAGFVRADGAYLCIASFYLWVVATTFLQIVLMLDDSIREKK